MDGRDLQQEKQRCSGGGFRIAAAAATGAAFGGDDIGQQSGLRPLFEIIGGPAGIGSAVLNPPWRDASGTAW